METLFVGIDFGSMNTGIAASNGFRRVIPTEVGWPKDAIAQEWLGKSCVFAEELDEHRPALRTIRPFANGALKYAPVSGEAAAAEATAESVMAATQVIRHAIELVKRTAHAQVRGVVGVPAQASLKNKQLLLDICEQAMDTVVLVPEPFAIGYGLGGHRQSLIVDIGAGTTDLCHYFGAMPGPSDLVTIGRGGDWIDEDFRQRVLAAHDNVLLSPKVARLIKEKYGFVGDVTEPILVRLPVRGGEPQTFDVTEPLRDACTVLADEVLAGILTLLDQVSPDYHASLLESTLLAGGGSRLHGFDNWLEARLSDYGKANVRPIPDSCFSGANGALQLAMHLPEAGWIALQRKDHGDAVATVEPAEDEPQVIAGRIHPHLAEQGQQAAATLGKRAAV